VVYNPKGVFENGEVSKTIRTQGRGINGKIWQGIQRET